MEPPDERHRDEDRGARFHQLFRFAASSHGRFDAPARSCTRRARTLPRPSGSDSRSSTKSTPSPFLHVDADRVRIPLPAVFLLAVIALPTIRVRPREAGRTRVRTAQARRRANSSPCAIPPASTVPMRAGGTSPAGPRPCCPCSPIQSGISDTTRMPPLQRLDRRAAAPRHHAPGVRRVALQRHAVADPGCGRMRRRSASARPSQSCGIAVPGGPMPRCGQDHRLPAGAERRQIDAQRIEALGPPTGNLPPCYMPAARDRVPVARRRSVPPSWRSPHQHRHAERFEPPPPPTPHG